MVRLTIISLAGAIAAAQAYKPYSFLDYDGNGSADVSVKVDSSYGIFRIDYSGNGFTNGNSPDVEINTSYVGGGTDDYAAPADYDGDGLTDVAIKNSYDFRINYAFDGLGNGGDWEYYYSNGSSADWGGANCKPAPGDYDGDGSADISVVCYDNTYGSWTIDYSNNGFTGVDVGIYNRGFQADMHAMPADYDGDGKTDMSFKDDGSEIWWIDYSSAGFDNWTEALLDWGGASAQAIPADYDGDGTADLAVFVADWYYGDFYIDYSGNGFTDDIFSNYDAMHTLSVYSGGYTPATVPLSSDYDGDGYADLAARNGNGEWYIDYSYNSFGSVDEWLQYWGLDGEPATNPLHKDNARMEAPKLESRKGEIGLTFALPRDSRVEIAAYDTRGKKIASLFSGPGSKGSNSVNWSRKDLGRKGLKRGLYFLRVEAEGFKASQRLVLPD
jgi:hypothetical protein